MEKNNKKEEKETLKQTKKIVKKQESQTKWILIIMGCILIAVFLTTWVVSDSKQFEYLGFNWQLETFGDIPIYSTVLSGYSANGVPFSFKLNLRNDPRKLESIPVEETPFFIRGKPIYWALDMESEVDKCGAIALVSFGQFMSGIGYELITSITTEDLAEKFERPFVNEINMPENSVIILTRGNETKIEVSDKNPNTYIITFKGCEIVEAIERFEIAVMSGFNKPVF